jgi:hypothetical protein
MKSELAVLWLASYAFGTTTQYGLESLCIATTSFFRTVIGELGTVAAPEGAAGVSGALGSAGEPGFVGVDGDWGADEPSGALGASVSELLGGSDGRAGSVPMFGAAYVVVSVAPLLGWSSLASAWQAEIIELSRRQATRTNMRVRAVVVKGKLSLLADSSSVAREARQ